jgi:hypothetical protein
MLWHYNLAIVMKVEQALVAVGGQASRLRAGTDLKPFAKSFMEVDYYPLLYWCLKSLQFAGIKRVVLAGDRREYLDTAYDIADLQLGGFEAVRLYHDEGAGVHGLPHQTMHLLDESFLFECGHATNMPSHYIAMDAAKTPDNVVFSAYSAHPSNPRQPVNLDETEVTLTHGEYTGQALAHPLLIDQAYANRLPMLGFDINRIIGHYAAAGALSYTWNEMAPEFDTADELDLSRQVHRAIVRRNVTAASIYMQPEILNEVRTRSH